MKQGYTELQLDTCKAHGLQGISNRKVCTKEAEESMIKFFKNLKTEADPYDSRMCRAGDSHLRDDEDDLLLPNYYTKRKLYERWVWESGWVANAGGGDSSYGSLVPYKPRNHDEKLLSCQQQPIVCKATFLNCWRTKFDTIKIGRLAKDTCADCWGYKEQLRKLDADKRKCDRPNALGEEEMGLNNCDNNVATNKSNQFLSSSDFHNQTTLNDLNDNHLRVISNLAKHVSMFETQRAYVKKKAEDAIADKVDGVGWKNNIYFDYSPNLDLPHFGSEQPRDTYYFSSLTVNAFGLVDHATEILSAHVYDEGEKKKGGNNVWSLLYNKLGRRGLF